jgi:predicted amino acid-binding ACT domain protein
VESLVTRLFTLTMLVDGARSVLDTSLIDQRLRAVSQELDGLIDELRTVMLRRPPDHAAR